MPTDPKSNRWRKEQSPLVKQGKNATVSSISPREEQTNSKANKSCKTLYDERTTPLRADGLPSSYDHLELVHSDVDFTPSPMHEKSKKALSISPSRPMYDGITVNHPRRSSHR